MLSLVEKIERCLAPNNATSVPATIFALNVLRQHPEVIACNPQKVASVLLPLFCKTQEWSCLQEAVIDTLHMVVKHHWDKLSDDNKAAVNKHCDAVILKMISGTGDAEGNFVRYTDKVINLLMSIAENDDVKKKRDDRFNYVYMMCNRDIPGVTVVHVILKAIMLNVALQGYNLEHVRITAEFIGQNLWKGDAEFILNAMSFLNALQKSPFWKDVCGNEFLSTAIANLYGWVQYTGEKMMEI